jgi:hypothetical protein
MQRRDLARIAAVFCGHSGRSSGNAGDVFEMLVRLSPGGQLRMASGPEQAYRARRLIDGAETWAGRLVSEDETWVLHSDDDDDPIWFIRFGVLRPGEYLTLHGPGGGPLRFQIVKVDYPADAGGLRGGGQSSDWRISHGE